MTGDLFINGVDANTNGIHMGRGFIDTLKTPLGFKEDLENESALKDGIQMLLSDVYAARDITLSFDIHGSSVANAETNRTYFNTLLNGRLLTIKVSGDSNYYRLVYTGKGVSYAHSATGMSHRFTAKFTEVDPTDRGASPKEGGLFYVPDDD